MSWQAYDRSENDALLREVVALREWKAAQEAVLYGASRSEPPPECYVCKCEPDSPVSSRNPAITVCRNCFVARSEQREP